MQFSTHEIFFDPAENLENAKIGNKVSRNLSPLIFLKNIKCPVNYNLSYHDVDFITNHPIRDATRVYVKFSQIRRPLVLTAPSVEREKHQLKLLKRRL